MDALTSSAEAAKRVCRAALVALAIALALGGCAQTGPRNLFGDAASDAEVERHVKRGYVPDHTYKTSATRERWTIDDETVDASLLLPTGAERCPLVVFLPGLGEADDSALAWRTAWAEAGYAVLALQPASEGVAVWKSDQARLGDFQSLARAHFSAASLARRARLLAAAFAEIDRKVAASAAWKPIDTSLIAVAGFDLGAQTAMVVAGERVAGAAAMRWPASVRAVVALSPYADFAGMGVADDFRDVRMPVLGVTSGEDIDAYGLVTSAGVRRAPFQYMPPGEKYLLLLAGAPHSLISGREAPDRTARDEAEASEGGQRSRGGRRGRGGFGGRDASGAQSSPGTPSINWKMELADAKTVSVAFLDATVKSDPVAREWLQKDAQRWLGDLAQLSSK